MAGVDFRELEDFRDKMQKLAERDAPRICDECAKELAGRLLTKVVKRTPVGVKPDKPENYTTRVTSENGRTRTMLTAEGANWSSHWSGYVGGTLRRGWTNGRKVSNYTEYAKALPVNVMNKNHIIDIINQVEYALT